ncbi:hypothetical protein [Flavobacterium panacagri]|uniref:hypothetical protein n=1 Tax=Flavobacterium panacagri TaxID=3034146 RepID=UPI0025A56C13|nr:hypothetical protein [Flavobacterium panacagri]
MKTLIYYCIILFCSNSILFGQSIAFPKDTAEYYKQIRNKTNKLLIKDSSYLNKKEDNVKKDTVSVYIIKLIEERKKFYIIHALKDDYHFRIKSMKNSNEVNSKNGLYIIKGRTYQLDIRDFNNITRRTFYSSKFKDTEECMSYLSDGEYLCGYNPKSEEQYSQVLNLKGLYLIEK